MGNKIALLFILLIGLNSVNADMVSRIKVVKQYDGLIPAVLCGYLSKDSTGKEYKEFLNKASSDQLFCIESKIADIPGEKIKHKLKVKAKKDALKRVSSKDCSTIQDDFIKDLCEAFKGIK